MRSCSLFKSSDGGKDSGNTKSRATRGGPSPGITCREQPKPNFDGLKRICGHPVKRQYSTVLSSSSLKTSPPAHSAILPFQVLAGYLCSAESKLHLYEDTLERSGDETESPWSTVDGKLFDYAYPGARIMEFARTYVPRTSSQLSGSISLPSCSRSRMASKWRSLQL